MASLDTKSLAQAICHENELAVEKSALIEGRDVVLFVGCCGSGKTTVASYVQGTKFKYSRGKLEEETKLEGFAIGDQRADVTQGLAFAEVPETEGLWLADSAGTGATSGVHAEVFGALNRSAVLQKARSVRLVLVIKEGRFDVGNERGRLVVKDIEHVASMFVDLSVNDNLKSVGVIVTSDPRGLQADGVAADIVSSMNDSLKQLHGQAVVDDGFVIVGDSSKASGMRTSSAGKWLMHHICENCNRAAQTVEEMDGTDDEAILRGLCSARIAVFPFNMLREGHRFYLKMWLRGLKPVEQPATSLTSALPAEARALLESHVSDSFIKYKKLIADHSGVWTRKEMLVPEIIDVVNLTFVLEESRLLPSVEKFRTDLGNQLLQENRNALVHLLAAVRGGAPAKAADPWSALLSMDGFRQQCSRITLEGWTSSTAALEECLDAAKESFAKYLPDGFASARWDSNLALQVSGIFECVRQLQPGSSDLLRMWALALLDHVRSLQSKSAECASATGTAQALARLEEHRDFLPDMVIPALCKYGCEALQGEALHQIVQESKDAVRQQLQRLSAQVVEETPSDGKPVLLEKLQHLCRSDELNRLLEDDLEQAYVVKPLCSKLAPQQEEIDNLEEQIRNSEPEQWRIALLDLSQRVAATADLAKMILHSKDLKWTGLLEAVSQHITSQKAVAISAVPKLASLSGCERQWAVVSNSGSGTGYDSDEGEVDKESGDLLEGTVEELCELVAVDTLFHLLGRRSDTAASALVAVGWSLKQSLNQALKRANRARDKSWVPSSSLSTATLFAMHSLNGLAKAAQTTIGPLKELQDVPVHGLPQALEKCISEARAFVDGFLQTEMGDWNDATTGAMGWPDLFSRHVKMANKLRGLATKDMRDAAQKLYQKVYDWHKHQLSEAQRAVCPAETSSGEAGTDDSWQIFLKHGVREGLAFEQTRLCRELDFKVQFRPLVAKQVEMCQTEAASAQPTERLRVWRNMTQLIQELQQVQGDDPQLCRFTEILLAARTPLDTDLGDTSSDFEKALNEKRYARAAELLLKVQKRQRHAEILHQHINDDFAITMKLLDSDHEGEATRAGQEARRLLQEVQLIEEAETKNTVQKRTEELTSKLERKMNEAQQQLQLALEGRRPPLPALSVCVALSGNSKMKTAIEAVNKFCANKKDMFLQMNTSELLSWMAKHDGVWRAMPDEMKGDSADYDALIEVFMQSFRAAFSKGLSALQNHQEQKQWVEAREVYEALSDAVDALLQLDVIGERHLKSLQSLKKTKLGGMSATRRSLIAREALKNGEFREALLLLVTSEEGKDLCDEIQDKLFEQNLSTTQDEGVLHERFSVLGAFLEAAGDNPPDELRETWQWVRQACSRAKPQIEATAQEKLMDTVSAASAADFVAFAASLLPLKKASCFLTPQQLLQAKQAVQSFLQHLTNIVEQVANEIQALDLQALRLSLGNVKLWLDTFQNLSGEEKEAVQDQLDLKLGLQAWISKSLADAMKGLMEPKAVLVAVETWDFREISVRCRVAAELDAVLKTGLIDMSHIEKYLAQRHDSAIHELENHTGSLKGFNAELKVLQNVTHELPECRAASHLVAQLGKALRENLLDRLSDNLRCARDVPAVVAASTELRQVAFDAPDTYEWVTSSLSAALHHLQNLAEFGVNGMHVCGSQLATTPIGKAIIGEHEDVFGAANEEERNISFRRAGETHDLNSIVSRLSDESGLGEDEKQWLEQALTAHESASKDLLEKYLYQTGACLDVARKQAKENLDMAVQQCKQDQNDDSTLAVIVHLSVCYTLVKSGSAFFLSAVQSQQDMLVIPHRAQILTVLRFLQVAHKTSKRKFWPAMFCRRGDKTNKRIYMNHLAQVQTGEGKCLTLGLLAALLAVNGIESDVVCYRQILTDQDHQAMLPFFEFLDIKDKIRYRTLDQLCSERLGDLTKASTELVEKQSVSVARHQLQLGHRALLLDEVDVLFSRKFYGHTWDGAFKLVSPQAQALVRFVFAEFSNGRLSSLMNITASKAFKELVGHYPPALHRALASVAVQLADNVQEWNKPEPFLDSSQSRIGYKDRDDVNYEICHANKTVFAYLNFEKTGKLAAEQVKPHVGIDLLCGRFSFADLPNMYSLILGVTGTLRELWDIPEFKDMLQKEYEINHFTYLPSIFGTSQLLFRPVEHVSVLKNEQDWMSRIAALASQESKAGNSVLVFFKNHRNLAKYPSWRKTECLTEQTDLKRRSGYIAAATASGQITLLTRAFGRGIDFQMPSDDGHTVVVIQTFLSSLISEERQLKGRTARQGKKGKFLQVLCAEELSAKMGFTEQDLETLTGGVESSILKILRDKQHEKTVAKMAGLVQRRKTSSVHEQQTRSFEKLVFRDDASVEDKLRKLASLNEQSANINIHYSVILDTSGSMAGRNQRQMNKAFNHFQKELCAQELKGSHIRASVILFETSAQVISQQTRPSDIPDISCHQAQGGTNFSRAFEACHTVMQESASDTHEFILFLTDGQAEFPETALNALLAAFEGRIKGLTCVAVGGDENTLPALQQIGHVFQARNIAFNLRDADDEATLVEVFGEVAASSRAIHLR